MNGGTQEKPKPTRSEVPNFLTESLISLKSSFTLRRKGNLSSRRLNNDPEKRLMCNPEIWNGKKTN